jgi:hypothetical protein
MENSQSITGSMLTGAIMTNTQSDPRKEYLRQWGFKDAARQDADPKTLQNCLGAVYQDYKKGTRSKEQECRNKIAHIQTELDRATNEYSRIEQREMQPRLEMIKSLKQEVEDIDVHPEKYKIESEFSLLGFTIGSMLLLLLTVFLFIFYSSSLHSAYIKNPGEHLEQSLKN